MVWLGQCWECGFLFTVSRKSLKLPSAESCFSKLRSDITSQALMYNIIYIYKYIYTYFIDIFRFFCILTDNEHHAIPPDSFWEDGWLNKQPLLHQDSKSSPSSHTPYVHLAPPKRAFKGCRFGWFWLTHLAPDSTLRPQLESGTEWVSFISWFHFPQTKVSCWNLMRYVL